MENDAVSVVRTFLEKVRSGIEPGLAEKLMAGKVSAHQVESEGPHTVQRTPRQYNEHIEEMKAAFGDFTISIDELFGHGDRVYARWTQVGRHIGTFDGVSPTGRPIAEVASAVYRIDNGVIVEYWMQIERLGLQIQLKRD
jgi:predicted ester cyclase